MVSLFIDNSVFKEKCEFIVLPLKQACVEVVSDVSISDYQVVILDNNVIIMNDSDVVCSFGFPLRIGAMIDHIFMIEDSFDGDFIEFSGYILEGSVLTNIDGGAIKLTEKERDILLELYNSDDNMSDKSSLLSNIWGYSDLSDTHTVETHIYRLRKKLEIDPRNPRILINIDGFYKLIV